MWKNEKKIASALPKAEPTTVASAILLYVNFNFLNWPLTFSMLTHTTTSYFDHAQLRISLSELKLQGKMLLKDILNWFSVLYPKFIHYYLMADVFFSCATGIVTLNETRGLGRTSCFARKILNEKEVLQMSMQKYFFGNGFPVYVLLSTFSF